MTRERECMDVRISADPSRQGYFPAKREGVVQVITHRQRGTQCIDTVLESA